MKKLCALILLALSTALIAQNGRNEKVVTVKTIVLSGSTAACLQVKNYLDEGAEKVTVERPWLVPPPEEVKKKDLWEITALFAP